MEEAKGQDDRDEVARRLARDFQIESAFVRVPMLARVLGLAEPTIYAAMRSGRFFIPHRMLGTTPAVKLDDLADWYRSDSGETLAAQASRRRAPSETPKPVGPEPMPRHGEREARDRRKKEIIDQAMSQMAKR